MRSTHYPGVCTKPGTYLLSKLQMRLLNPATFAVLKDAGLQRLLD